MGFLTSEDFAGRLWRQVWAIKLGDTVRAFWGQGDWVSPEPFRPAPFYYFPRAGITIYHKYGVYNNRNVFSYSSGEWKSEINMLAAWVPREAQRENQFQASLLASGGCPQPMEHLDL